MPKVRIEFDTSEHIVNTHLFVDEREVRTSLALFVGVAGDMPYFVYLEDDGTEEEQQVIYDAIRAYAIVNEGKLESIELKPVRTADLDNAP